jgi:hypothetical protein
MKRPYHEPAIIFEPCTCAYCKSSKWKRFVSGVDKLISFKTFVIGLGLTFLAYSLVFALHWHPLPAPNTWTCRDTAEALLAQKGEAVTCHESAVMTVEPFDGDHKLIRCTCPRGGTPAGSSNSSFGEHP